MPCFPLIPLLPARLEAHVSLFTSLRSFDHPQSTLPLPTIALLFFPETNVAVIAYCSSLRHGRSASSSFGSSQLFSCRFSSPISSPSLLMKFVLKQPPLLMFYFHLQRTNSLYFTLSFFSSLQSGRVRVVIGVWCQSEFAGIGSDKIGMRAVRRSSPFFAGCGVCLISDQFYAETPCRHRCLGKISSSNFVQVDCIRTQVLNSWCYFTSTNIIEYPSGYLVSIHI